MNNDEHWMRHALDLAERAAQEGEVPVGAVIVIDNQLIAEGWNQSVSSNDVTAHAEVMAIRVATTILNNYRILDSSLYTTLEPCVMCAGVIFHARISRVVFGAYDPKSGCAGSVIDLFSNNSLNHHAEIRGGVLECESSDLLKNFFTARR